MGIWGVRGHGEIGFHFHYKPLLRREIRILAQLGLGQNASLLGGTHEIDISLGDCIFVAERLISKPVWPRRKNG